MKKLISSIVCAVLPLGLLAADIDQETILRQIDTMQKQIAAQQAQIEALKSQLTTQEEVTEMVSEAIDTRGLAAAAGGVATSNDWIEQWTATGDLRIRYEYIERDITDSGEGTYDETAVTRFNHRARVGLKWTAPSENWEVAIGLITGGEDIPTAVNPNTSWNEDEVWEREEIDLDYAYAKHSWDAGSLTIGQQKNPFTTTWMMFDPDLRPTGATGMYCGDMFFVTAGAYNLRGDNTAAGSHQSLANLYAGQLGIMLEMEPVSALAAVSYFHYDDETTEFELTSADVDYQYQIGAAYAQLAGTVEDVAWKVYGEVAINFGADNDATQFGDGAGADSGYNSKDEDLAWIAGAELQAFGLTLHYAYAYVEGEAIPYFVADHDWGKGLMHSLGTGIEGHKFGVAYDLTKHCTLGASAILTDYIDASAAAFDEDAAAYMLDLTYKF